MQLHQYHKQIRQSLADCGIENAAREAALLLAHVLGIAPARLHLTPERMLLAEERALLNELVMRRCAREPLQYIIGHQEFWSLDFRVEPGVLIPRPESEFLVEQALALAPRIAVEIGTGSGAIAIALAVHLRQCMVYATDLSPEALRVASANALQHGVADRVIFCQGHMFEPLEGLRLEKRVDVLISNPPYVASEQLVLLPPEVRDYEPRVALDGGADGLRFYRHLSQAHPWLAPCGKLLLEVGAGQADAVQHILEATAWKIEGIQRDYAGIPRTVQASSVRRDGHGFHASPSTG